MNDQVLRALVPDAGWGDGAEVAGPTAAYPACRTNPLSLDSDRDTLADGAEVKGFVLTTLGIIG